MVDVSRQLHTTAGLFPSPLDRKYNGPRTALDSFGEEKLSSLAGLETQLLAFPSHSLVIIQPTLCRTDLAQQK